MSPIERAARALCELDGNPPGATMDGKPLWQDYVSEVRAVLSAIREPDADHARQIGLRNVWQCNPDDIGGVYSAMIDAAIEEG